MCLNILMLPWTEIIHSGLLADSRNVAIPKQMESGRPITRMDYYQEGHLDESSYAEACNIGVL